MTPPAFEAQAIGEVQHYNDPDKTAVPLKSVWVILLFFFGVGSSAVAFIGTQAARDASFKESVMKLEARSTINEATASEIKASVAEVKVMVTGIDAKLEVQAEIRARQNAADERMNRLERALERTGRASATAAHITPNES